MILLTHQLPSQGDSAPPGGLSTRWIESAVMGSCPKLLIFQYRADNEQQQPQQQQQRGSVRSRVGLLTELGGARPSRTREDSTRVRSTGGGQRGIFQHHALASTP